MNLFGQTKREETAEAKAERLAAAGLDAFLAAQRNLNEAADLELQVARAATDDAEGFRQVAEQLESAARAAEERAYKNGRVADKIGNLLGE